MRTRAIVIGHVGAQEPAEVAFVEDEDVVEALAAADHYHRALNLAQQLDMRPLVAHCHLGLGTLCQRTGDQAKAAAHLTTATTMCRAMGMNFWLEHAETELAGTG